MTPPGSRVLQHHDAAAVRDDQQRPGDGLRLAFDRRQARRAVEVVTTHSRHAVHRPTLGSQRRHELGLPMLGDVVAQARHDEDRGVAEAVE